MKKLVSVLFFLSIVLIPFSLVLRFQEAPGRYSLFVLGVLGVGIYSIAKVIRFIVSHQKPNVNYLLFCLSVLMSFSLFTKYQHWGYGDYPGLIIIPAFVVMALVYLIKRKKAEYKLTIISVLYLILSIPIFGFEIKHGPRKYIPISFGMASELAREKNQVIEEDSLRTIKKVGEGEGIAVELNGNGPIFESDLAKSLYYKGRELHSVGRYTDAKITVLKAYNLEPQNLDILNELGLLCKRKEQFKEAEKYFLTAINIDSTFYMAYNNLGLSYYYAGEFERGISILKKIENIGSMERYGLSNYYHQAMNYYGLNDCVNARKYFQLVYKNTTSKALKDNVDNFINGEVKHACPNCLGIRN